MPCLSSLFWPPILTIYSGHCAQARFGLQQRTCCEVVTSGREPAEGALLPPPTSAPEVDVLSRSTDEAALAVSELSDAGVDHAKLASARRRSVTGSRLGLPRPPLPRSPASPTTAHLCYFRAAMFVSLAGGQAIVNGEAAAIAAPPNRSRQAHYLALFPLVLQASTAAVALPTGRRCSSAFPRKASFAFCACRRPLRRGGGADERWGGHVHVKLGQRCLVHADVQ